MKDVPITVVYLARCAEGAPSVQRFLAAYRLHPAGVNHRLLIAAKGWDTASSKELLATIVGGIGAEVRHLPDDGFDLGAYRRILPECAGHHVVFLNTHSEPLVPNWLSLMVRHAAPGRLLGATASWNSHRPDRLTAYPSWKPLKPRFRSRLWRAWLGFREAWADLGGYNAFPNPHVRTNGFLLPPELHHLVLSWSIPEDKHACYRLESGLSGLSAQVLASGGTLWCAGADGRLHAVEQWPAAGIFCSQRQQHLIIADNQTRDYSVATPDRQRLLHWYTWRSFPGCDIDTQV